MGTCDETSESRKLISQLLIEDEDLRDIVEEFVQNLDDRMEEFKQAHATMDWEHLTTLAHQLKGAAGSYGYPDISDLCAGMERQFRAQQADEITTMLNGLNELVAAAREGLTEVP